MSDYARKIIEREIKQALSPAGPAVHSGRVTLDISHVRYVLAERDAAMVAEWMIRNGYATGHGDTVDDLLKEMEWQSAERAIRARGKA